MVRSKRKAPEKSTADPTLTAGKAKPDAESKPEAEAKTTKPGNEMASKQTATPNTSATNSFFSARTAAAASQDKAEGGGLKRKQLQLTEEPLKAAATTKAPLTKVAKKKGKK